MAWRERIRQMSGGSSRRGITGLLAGLSVLTARPSLDLFTTLDELVDIGVATFVIYQSSDGSPVLGLHIAWIFIGYFVFAYTPDLYPEQYGDIVDARGFRALIALAVVFTGIWFSRVWGIVPGIGAFALIPQSVGPAMLVIGFVAVLGTLGFSGYLFLWHRKQLFSEDSDQLELIKWVYEPNSQSTPVIGQIESITEEISKLPYLWRELAVGFLIVYFLAPIHLLPAIVLGGLLAAINLFYPLPELLAIVLVVISYTAIPKRLNSGLSVKHALDIQFHLTDRVASLTQNSKGRILGLYVIIGMASSGFFFATGFSSLVESARDVLPVVINIGTLGSRSLSELPLLFARFWFELGIIVLPLIYGVYGLLYWAQELKRLPPYIFYWEKHWNGDAPVLPATKQWRPRGLLLPGAALLVLWEGGSWLRSGAEAELSLGMSIGYSLAWTISVAIVVWSIRTVPRNSTRYVDNEGRDVTCALLLQLTTIIVVLTQFLPIQFTDFTDLLFGLSFAMTAYVPDAVEYGRWKQGARQLLALVYVILVGVFALIGFVGRTDLSLAGYLFLGGGLLLFLLSSAILVIVSSRLD